MPGMEPARGDGGWRWGIREVEELATREWRRWMAHDRREDGDDEDWIWWRDGVAGGAGEWHWSLDAPALAAGETASQKALAARGEAAAQDGTWQVGGAATGSQ
ncbi:Os05g0420400 [Oryza sativa Japonica Group]|uniref:Os05g0420400 protein n=1 Tax=Oryza sativa subsp. japonica TaxID=39947 RepID=A0A0P0WMF9_ORYSJ|nr:Os05g0420400 [Oryza sativa Japonica Group]